MFTISKFAKACINGVAILMIIWVVYVVYCTFTDSGIWHTVVDWIASDATERYSPMTAFGICVLIGILPAAILIAIIFWLSNVFNKK